jgi:ubiquinone/menaquinone biosynthesis C-methylase UbiE/uncharacterized protein YbaR (Trm112 family)
VNASLLHLMRCPFCDGELTADCGHREGENLRYGILHCYCSKWPIVEGIPVIRKDAAGGWGELLQLVEAGRFDDALKSCLSINICNGSVGTLPRIKHSIKGLLTSHWVGRWPRSLPRIGKRLADFSRSERLKVLWNQHSHDATVQQYLAAFYSNMRDNYDYFFHRFSQPRYLVALSLASIIRQPNGPLLDLACGCGHVTRALLARSEGQLVVGMDWSFFNLYVAKRWIAPDAHFVCCDADQRYPFSDRAFAAVVCSDAFHYFVAKSTCFRECERLTGDRGLLLLIYMHNAQVRLPFDGIPLPVEGYESLAAHRPHRLLSDRGILAGYLRKEGPCLAKQVDIEELAAEPTLSLVVSHKNEVFRDYGPYSDWPHTYGRLSLNPLYVREGPVCWKRNLPSAFFERDHHEIKDYLPDEVSIPPTLLESLDKQQRTAEMERLIAKCVILGLPDAYV